MRNYLCCEPATLTAMSDPLDDADNPTSRLANEVLSQAGVLVERLSRAVELIENNNEEGVIEHPDTRREVGFDSVLEGIGSVQAALDEVGDDLIALAALAGYPMRHLGELVGLSETAIPVRLARTPRLAPFARVTGNGKPRVGRPELGAAAWDYRRGESSTSD